MEEDLAAAGEGADGEPFGAAEAVLGLASSSWVVPACTATVLPQRSCSERTPLADALRTTIEVPALKYSTKETSFARSAVADIPEMMTSI